MLNSSELLSSVYLIGYTPHRYMCVYIYVCIEKEEQYYTTAGLHSNNNAKKSHPIQPSMQEDYYTYCIICRELGYYMLPV